MFSWPAVVRSCLLHHTYASIYVDKYSLSSIRIILTIFHELATINIYVPAHSRGKKKSTCRYGWCGTIHLRIRSCFNRKIRCYARHMSFSCAAHPWLSASQQQQEKEQLNNPRSECGTGLLWTDVRVTDISHLTIEYQEQNVRLALLAIPSRTCCIVYNASL